MAESQSQQPSQHEQSLAQPIPHSEPQTQPQTLENLILSSQKSLLPTASRVKYAGYAKHFTGWLTTHNKNIEALDATLVAAYVEDLCGKYKASTIWTRMSGVKAIVLADHNIDMDPLLVKAKKILAQKGKQEAAKQSPVFTKDQISQYLRSLNHTTELHFKLAVMCQWFGGLRKTEALNMTFEDTVRDDGFVLVTIPRSKTDQAGKGTSFYMMKNTSDPLCCPVRVYDEYIARVPVKAGRLFLQFRRGAFTRQVLGKSWCVFSRIFKWLLKFF
jgi:integrase